MTTIGNDITKVKEAWNKTYRTVMLSESVTLENSSKNFKEERGPGGLGFYLIFLSVPTDYLH